MKARNGAARGMLAAVLSLLLLASPASSQTYRGSILGTVLDETGAVVPAATITVTNAATGVARTTTTDAEGNFVVTELPIGQYEIGVQKEGFSKGLVKDVEVGVSGDRQVDITLKSGAVSEEVEVIAEVPIVQTTTNVLGGTISNEQLQELPINGRDYQKVLYMVPGSQGDPAGGSDSPGSFGLFSSNGNRGRANNYLLDGTDMNDGYRNLPSINQGGVFGAPGSILPVEVIAEAAILSNTEGEFGRNAGATVNIVTRSGGNEIHGSVYEFVRNDIFDARNVFNIDRDAFGNELPQAAFRNNQFGFSLGGPFVKNETFWFVAYEGQRERVGLPSRARVPDPLEIARLGGATNPVIRRLLDLNPWPAPNIAEDANGNNLALITPASNDLNSFIVKVDHAFNERNQFSARYFLSDADQSFPLALLAGGVLPGYNTDTLIRVNLVALSHVWVVSDTKVNETRFGYNRYHQDFFAEDREFDPRSIGLNTGTLAPVDFGLPEIRVAGFAALGSNRGNPRGRIDTNWHFVDNLSWKVGTRHDVKLGYEFRRTFVNGFFDAGYRGRLNFDSLEDFLAGRLAGGRSVIGDSRRGTFQNNHSAFVQDSWKVKRNVTLNASLRWDYYGVIGEERDRFSNFSEQTGLFLTDQLYEKDFNNFAPRLSIAWNVGGRDKTVVRAGWGVYFDAYSQDFFVGQLPWNTFNSGPAYNPIGPDPVLFSFSTVDEIREGQPIFTDFLDSDVFAVDPELATPYVQNFNVNIQQELFDGGVLQVGYVGSQGRKLFRYTDINQAVPGNGGARPYDAGPFAPSGGTFFYVNHLETTAVSNYNSLQTSFTVRNKRGFSTNVDYTWSHAIDTASDGQDYVPNASQPDDSRRIDLERASSNFDIRHAFVWDFIYEIPHFTDKAKWLTQGWQLNGVTTIRSGSPVNVNWLFYDDFNGTGEFFPRPDIVGDPYAGTSEPDNFLNLSAFAVPCTLRDGSCIPGTEHIGTLGRNALIGPNFENFDFSVYKTNRLGENVVLQLRFEFFNLFNHPNYASPFWPGFAVDAGFNGISDDGRGIGFLPLTVTPDVGFGNPFLGGGGPRNIQFGARLSF